MTGVRNGVLARARLDVAGDLLLARVPANFTWLIKTVHLLNASANSSTSWIALVDPVGNITALVFQAELTAGGAQTWEGWTSAMPGDQVILHSDQVPTHVWLSGAELPGLIQPSQAV
jgi:hypothetical protein